MIATARSCAAVAAQLNMGKHLAQRVSSGAILRARATGRRLIPAALTSRLLARRFLSTVAVDKDVHNHDRTRLSGLPQTIFFSVTLFIQDDSL